MDFRGHQTSKERIQYFFPNHLLKRSHSTYLYITFYSFNINYCYLRFTRKIIVYNSEFSY